LDYCNSVWAPYRKSDIETLEKVQKKATIRYIKGLQLFTLSLCLVWIVIIKAHVVTWPNWVSQGARKMSENISFHIV